MIVTAVSLLWLSTAAAQEPATPPAEAPPPEPPPHDVLLGIHGVAEVWSDAAIASVYRSSAFTGSISATWQFHRFLEADLELMYFRTSGEDGQRFEMTPISADVSAYRTFGSVELYGGLGPALVPFSDQGVGLRTGTKLGLDARVGLRIGTSLYDPPDYPPSPIERVDLEIYVGRRTHFGSTTTALDPSLGAEPAGRIDLSAVRAGIGFKVRL